MAAPARVHDLRARRVLQRLEEQARHQALPSFGTPDHQVLRAGGGLGLVLRGRRLFQALARTLNAEIIE